MSRKGRKMSYIEENALAKMQNIFTAISNDEGINIKGYFASDMVKVNGKSCVYPCFVGYTSTSIFLVRINEQLEKEELIHINDLMLKEVNVKKGFLSKFLKMKVFCNDGRSFIAGVPQKLKYIETQQEHVDGFREQFSAY